MCDRPILYAKAGGPPSDWRGLRVFYKANGREIRHVVEVNAHEGWVVVALLDEKGRPRRRADGEKITRRFRAAVRIERAP